MSRYLVLGFDGSYEGFAHQGRLGTLGVRGDRWDVRCWGSGVVVGGSVRSTSVTVGQAGPCRARVGIQSKDERFHASVTVCVGSRRLERRLEAAGALATELAERRRSAADGEWWLDPRAFRELGEASAISVPGTRYLDGWDGPVRSERGSGGRILDFDLSGVTLRGIRRHLQIPWADVRGIDVEGDPLAVVVRVRTDRGDARFESHEATPTDLRARLRPLVRRLQLAGQADRSR